MQSATLCTLTSGYVWEADHHHPSLDGSTTSPGAEALRCSVCLPLRKSVSFLSHSQPLDSLMSVSVVSSCSPSRSSLPPRNWTAFVTSKGRALVALARSVCEEQQICTRCPWIPVRERVFPSPPHACAAPKCCSGQTAVLYHVTGGESRVLSFQEIHFI